MYKNEHLRQYAYNKNIKIMDYSFSKTKKAMCAEYSSTKAVILDTASIETKREEASLLAEELGHLETGSLYTIEDITNPNYRTNIWKAEAKAARWAIKKLIPKDELKKVEKQGLIEIWELAEYFEVSEEFMNKAIEYYNTVR